MNTEQQRYASPRTALVLAVVLIQMSEPLHNFHIQICDFGQCNVGVESPSWEQSSWYQPTSNCPCQDLSNCSLWICSNYVQLGFVKEGELYLGQDKANWPVWSGGVGQWRMPGACIKFQICLVAIIHTVRPCTICLTFWFMLCRPAINAEATVHTSKQLW